MKNNYSRQKATQMHNNLDRRQLLKWGGYGLGGIALSSLLKNDAAAWDSNDEPSLRGFPHFAPKAKRVVFLTQSGAPSQIELFDPKPNVVRHAGIELPDSVRMGQAVSTMTRGKPQIVMPSITKFAKHGKCGTEFGEWIPHIAGIADDICVVRSMTTEFINHAPAMTFLLSGNQIPGRPSLGGWVQYGLGSENRNLPGFVVLVSKTGNTGDQPLYDHYWGTGFLPSRHQGVRLRSSGEPVLFLNNPSGVSRSTRRLMLDDLKILNTEKHDEYLDPEIKTRIAQYELGFRMQTSVPELADMSDETEETYELYGPESQTPGSYAHNCIMARRLLQRGVRFVQVFLGDWDHHNGMRNRHRDRARSSDQPSAALVKDLKRMGMLDDTLVVWGGEFGRGIAAQTKETDPANDPKVGRDHHPRCFSVWMAGGGVKGGTTYGATDDFSFNVTENPVHVHDLQATILHLLGIDHKRHTFRFMGRDFRLTDVHGHVVKDIIA